MPEPQRSRLSAFQPARWRTSARGNRVASLLGKVAPAKRGFPWYPVAAVLILIVVGFWTRHAVNESLSNILTDQLETILDADITALEIWIDGERKKIERQARDPHLREAVGRLTALERKADDPGLLGADDRQRIRDTLRAEGIDKDIQGYGIVTPEGLVLAARRDHLVGQRLSAHGSAHFEQVFAGETVLGRPYLRTRAFDSPADADPSEGTTVPLPSLLAATPIRDENDAIIAALLVETDPHKDFTRILSVARFGDTGETYAFDDRGVMISESRFEDELIDLGLLPERTEDAAYALQLRDPGGDLTRGHVNDTPVASRPLTINAAEALAGRDGIEIDGYRDYRGVEVIGAWRWLDEYSLGVATEVDVVEAFKLRRPLNIAFAALLTLLALATVAILAGTYSIGALSRGIERARQLGQYTLEGKIGEGGMGTVYRARHALLRRPTALKVLRKDVVTPENVARFEREVQLTSRLNHPNTIEIYDYGQSPDGTFYYAMEFLPGVTLAKLIDTDGALPPARVVNIIRQVCASLEEAHGIGLVHRDIKPLNIMLCRFGPRPDVVKVLDFGLVKDVSTPEELQVTSPEIVGGTPPYIAPERLKDPTALDPRSDLFAVGAVAYNLLTGQDVFTGASAMQICYKVMHEDPPRPSAHAPNDLSPALEELVLATLSREPDGRPATARALIEALDAIDGAGTWDHDDAAAWWASRDDQPESDSNRTVSS
ncbi:MAG: serine/threonine protein kinase [Planctomycetes bacterium]|nr:serine/threonine protein kinase [Planctomycetota bacterium]